MDLNDDRRVNVTDRTLEVMGPKGLHRGRPTTTVRARLRLRRFGQAEPGQGGSTVTSSRTTKARHDHD